MLTFLDTTHTIGTDGIWTKASRRAVSTNFRYLFSTECWGTKRYLCACTKASGSSFQGARPRPTFSGVRDMICDSNHFTLAALSRWSVMHSELNEHNEHGSVGSRGRGAGREWRKQHLAGPRGVGACSPSRCEGLEIEH